MEEDYHERQRARDCSVHSLNNALGRRVISPEEVIIEIKRRVEAYNEECHHLGVSKEKISIYEKSLADGKTYFTAEAVWVAALSLGRIGELPQDLKNLVDIKAGTIDESVQTMSLVILGKTRDNTYHAIAVREGKIRDSLQEGALDFTHESLSTIYSEILGVYKV